VTTSPQPRVGIYQCCVCHSALFDAATQFEYGTGAWPNFTQPISEPFIAIHTQPVGRKPGTRSAAPPAETISGSAWTPGRPPQATIEKSPEQPWTVRQR